MKQSDSSTGLLERAQTATGFLNRLHPLTKLGLTLLYIVLLTSFNRYDIAGIMLFFFYPCILLPLSEIPLSLLIKRLLPVLPFLLLMGLGNLYFDHFTLYYINDFAITTGLLSCLSIIIKGLLSITAMLLLCGTTPFYTLGGELRRLHVPAILLQVIFLIYHYLWLWWEEAKNIRCAYLLKTGYTRIKIADAGLLLGNLLLRCQNRGEAIYAAWLCRGAEQGFAAASALPFKKADILSLLLTSWLLLAMRFMRG